MAEKQPAPAVEPDAQVLKAITELVKAARSPKVVYMTNANLEGFVRGFLLQYPSIALAETAKRIIAHDLRGEMADARDNTIYAEATNVP